MRIIGGKFKGHGLFIDKNKNTRPLKDMVRESIFNLLDHSNKINFEIKKSNILDLYSGTGSFGLECLSREAESLHFVERDKNSLNILEKNIEKLKLKKKSNIFFEDIFEFIKKRNFLEKKFDLIFCDPPFKDTNISMFIELIFEKNLLKKNGIIILHRNRNTKDDFPKIFQIIDFRIYGISKIYFGRLS